MTYSSQFSKSRRDQINATAAAMPAVGNFIVLENKWGNSSIRCSLQEGRSDIALFHSHAGLISANERSKRINRFLQGSIVWTERFKHFWLLYRKQNNAKSQMDLDSLMFSNRFILDGRMVRHPILFVDIYIVMVIYDTQKWK